MPSHFRSFTHKATEYLLATSSANNDDMNSADTILQLRLCDGVSTWAGQLPPAKLTPPTRGAVSPAEFRKRLIAGLRGDDDSFKSTLSVEEASGSNGGVRLHWEATVRDEEFGIDLRLKQDVDLAADLLPGDGLRALLAELVDETSALQSDIAARGAEAATLRGQLAELDEVGARLERAQGDVQKDRRRSDFLNMLNRKKRRIRDLDAACERAEGGVHANASPARDDDDDDDDDDDEPEFGAAAAAGPSNGHTSGGGGGGGVAPSSLPAAKEPADEDDNVFDLL